MQMDGGSLFFLFFPLNRVDTFLMPSDHRGFDIEVCFSTRWIMQNRVYVSAERTWVSKLDYYMRWLVS